ncbi:hypothetical protein MLD52_23030, partial [Puniceicoccaceae bacterium K14]|nr:hypothetical protein [Puniceicoccaceae bacterium K14]
GRGLEVRGKGDHENDFKDAPYRAFGKRPLKRLRKRLRLVSGSMSDMDDLEHFGTFLDDVEDPIATTRQDMHFPILQPTIKAPYQRKLRQSLDAIEKIVAQLQGGNWIGIGDVVADAP